mmetsp:Transcript_96287/g.171040  ORF Transcript_96287/g.171040 Transcript_96287/m.171040 type:complete len:200 (-) Transcript_96287:59-658(-)
MAWPALQHGMPSVGTKLPREAAKVYLRCQDKGRQPISRISLVLAGLPYLLTKPLRRRILQLSPACFAAARRQPLSLNTSAVPRAMIPIPDSTSSTPAAECVKGQRPRQLPNLCPLRDGLQIEVAETVWAGVATPSWCCALQGQAPSHRVLTQPRPPDHHRGCWKCATWGASCQYSACVTSLWGCGPTRPFGSVGSSAWL